PIDPSHPDLPSFPTRRSSDLPCIPSGTYTLLANAPPPGPQIGPGRSLTAALPLTVNADLSGIHIALLPNANIPIHMRVISSRTRSEEHTSELQSLRHLVCRLL